jgi:signal transduction histidine kinase/CheY-like chemotaxis protein
MTVKDIDKYHKKARDDNKYLNPLFDIKEVPKRAYQLGLAALCLGIALAVYDAYISMYVSSFLLGCFCFAILMFMYLKHNGDINNLTICIIALVCGMLVSSAILEGLDSEQYLYFFPILIAVPVIVNLKQTRYRQSVIYIGIILCSFIATILIGHYTNHQESFKHLQIERLAFVNRVLAICSTIVFAMAYIFFEEKYIHELTEQSKNVIDSRTRFLATMGHELRTPLNGIIGIINLLKQDHGAKEHEEYLQVLKYCSDHMLQQVNNILDFNKIEADKLDIFPVPLNLTQLLLNVSMPFIALIQEKGLSFKIDIDPRLDMLVMADDLRLIQVFNNLFSNALKFTESGHVKLKATLINDDPQFATVNFIVEDTGIGLSEDDQKLIFERFWQVQDKNTRSLNGTGLGLTICVRLLKLMNSKLNLVSEKGNGSKFNFELKLEHTGQQYSNVMIGPEDNLAGIHILLAEDNPINMMVAEKVLTGYEATVTGAYNGREALNILEKNPAFDIILLDLEMPVMNGYQAIFEMKKSYPNIPVLAFTASLVDENMLIDLYGSGFEDCILKPFQPHQLLSVIKKHIAVAPAVI